MARLPGLPRFVGGAVGFLTYEIARCFERLPVPANDPHGLPLGRLMFVDIAAGVRPLCGAPSRC